MSKSEQKPVHNDANKTLPIKEPKERIQGETGRSQQAKK